MSIPKKRNVVVLGSTGSIGKSSLQVARSIPDRMEIVGLAAGTNAHALAKQARETGAKHVALFNKKKEAELRAELPKGVQIYLGPEGLLEIASLQKADTVLMAIVGTSGLEPTLTAIEYGKDIALATKEILVMAGELIMKAAKEKNVNILPVDSEHNAVFQCLNFDHVSSETLSRIILTASGGPFRKTPAEELDNVTLVQALKHPTWDMGRKITLDSATLFNKGLEMIEASWLFKVPMNRIDVLVHPQSIIHSMVEFIDGSVLAQMSQADMCFPIQYAMTWPERVSGSLRSIDFSELSKLEFEPPRYKDFPALDLARRAGEEGSL